jgi:hypothetical protein
MSGVGIVIIIASLPQAPASNVKARGTTSILVIGDLRVRDIRMTAWQSGLGIAALSAGLVLGVGCAKDPTSVFVTMDADATVPPLLILRTTIARADDPATRSSAERSSPYASDAADRPGPFLFPLGLSVTVDTRFAGAVVVTVEGLDWDTRAVIASGNSRATVVAQQATQASLTLTAVTAPGADGGTD